MSQKSILSQRDKDLIRKYMVGGAAVGGGAALVTSLVNYLRHLNATKTDKDDDTLYVYRDNPDGQIKSAVIGGGLAITGGLLSTIGAYALVKKIYSSIRKKEAQDELNNAQRAFLTSQGYKPTSKKELEKEASNKPMSVFEGVTSIPVALPLLLAIGSGVVAHKMLDKAFPTTKPKVKPPRRVEIIDRPPVEEKEEVIEKPAFVREDDGFEFLLRMLSLEKNASSDVCNLIAAIADGELPAFKNSVDTVGYMNALDTVKGASLRKINPFNKHMAITYLAKSAKLKYQTGVIAAGEFAEKHPHFYKMACALSEETKEDLYNIIQLVGHGVRSELSEELGINAPAESLEKYALSDEVMESFMQLASSKGKPAAKGDSDESSGTSGEESGQPNPDSPSRQKKTKFIASSKTGRGFIESVPDDIIDKILTPSPADND